MTILLGDKSPIEKEAIGAIFQESHLLLLSYYRHSGARISESFYVWGLCGKVHTRAP